MSSNIMNCKRNFKKKMPKFWIKYIKKNNTLRNKKIWLRMKKNNCQKNYRKKNIIKKKTLKSKKI